MPDEQPPGLRERKKLDTRKALSDAALELTLERGLDQVIREDIAARAGVSPRTFSNYFSSKYDALAYRTSYRLRLSAELLAARPADEPLWTAIAEAVIAPLRADGASYPQPSAAQLAQARRVNATPEMQAAVARASTTELVAAIAARTGTDPERDLYPRLVATVTIGATNAVLERYLDAAEPLRAIPTLLRRAFAQISAGLPPPTRR